MPISVCRAKNDCFLQKVRNCSNPYPQYGGLNCQEEESVEEMPVEVIPMNPNPVILFEDIYSTPYEGAKIFTSDCDENRWLTTNYFTGLALKLDLGGEYYLKYFDIKNTHDNDFNASGMKEFRIEVSADDVDYVEVIDGILPNAYGMDCNVQLLTFEANPIIKARYIKFYADSYFYNRPGLQFFQVRST